MKPVIKVSRLPPPGGGYFDFEHTLPGFLHRYPHACDVWSSLNMNRMLGRSFFLVSASGLSVAAIPEVAVRRQQAEI